MTEDAVPASTRIICLGNLWRGDDAAGLLAARELRERLAVPTRVFEADGDGLAFLDLIEGAARVILIDAVKGGGQPGRIIRLDLSQESRWGAAVPCSTHALGLGEAIDLARTLGRLPQFVIFYGIVIESVELGAPLSEPVQEGIDRIVSQVKEEVERAPCMKCI